MSTPYLPVLELGEAVPNAARFPLVYPLEPRGLGTGSIECLTSYICRLAKQHSMLTAVFLREVLVPAMPASSRVQHKLLNYHLYTADGYGLMSRRLVEALAHLQRERHAEWLTALSWRHVFSRTGSGLHPATFRRWCPLCWRQDALNGHPVYGHLAWTVGAATVCLHHEIPLEESCPHCGKVQLAIPGLPFLDLCSQCGHDLKLIRPRRVKPSAHEKALWMARAVDKLIERTCANHIDLPEKSFSGKLREYIDCYADGRPSNFARLLNLSAHQMYTWSTRRSLPGFVPAMELCYRLDCPPDRFLLEPIELLPPDIWRRRLQRPRYATKNGYTEKQVQKMERILNRAVRENKTPPPLITDIARRLRVRYCFLRWRFPAQYGILVKRSQEWRTKQAKLKFENRLHRLQRGYRKLLSQGIYPSQRQLKRHGYLLPSELRLATVRVELAKLLKNTAERVFRHRAEARSRKKRRR